MWSCWTLFSIPYGMVQYIVTIIKWKAYSICNCPYAWAMTYCTWVLCRVIVSEKEYILLLKFRLNWSFQIYSGYILLHHRKPKIYILTLFWRSYKHTSLNMMKYFHNCSLIIRIKRFHEGSFSSQSTSCVSGCKHSIHTSDVDI